MNPTKTAGVSHRHPKSGFTLIEILVVIAIIAILASAFIVAAGLAINSAKRAKANVTMTQIQTGIYNYQTEYGLYPVPSTFTAGTDAYLSDGDVADWENLCWALCGNISAYDNSTKTPTVSNTRIIAYLTPKKSDVDANGIIINPFFTSTVASSSNPYFYLVMDFDYSGLAGDSSGTKLPDFTNWTGTTTAYSAAPTLAKGITQGAALWVDCDPKALPPTESTSKAPALWVHTY